MKQFDLTEYLRLKEEGKEPKIVTRDGRDARIICTDMNEDQPIVALVSRNATHEQPYTFSAEGCFDYDGNTSDLDLFFAPTKHKGWVNVYTDRFGICCHRIHDTEKEARKNAQKSDSYVATVPIEWEE